MARRPFRTLPEIESVADEVWQRLDRADWLEAFAAHSLQETLYAMGETALSARPEIAEIRMAMPNKHHFLVDLSRFGLENNNEVFHADDRSYGLIEGTVRRDDARDVGLAWSVSPIV